VEAPAPRKLTLRYLLHFPVIVVLLFVLIGYTPVFPAALWPLLFYSVVLGGWMSASVASHHLLAARLASKRTGLDPWMQVLLTIAWSVGNLVVIGAIAAGLVLMLRPTR
jgi:hypothetical protein